MSIVTSDNFGNYFLGNFLAAGHSFHPEDLLLLMRTALGSNDRANVNFSTGFRIDWRPNIATETLTGAVSVPTAAIINTSHSSVSNNARLAYSVPTSSSLNRRAAFLNTGISTGLNSYSYSSSYIGRPFWACADATSISFYFELASNKLFMSQGVLRNSVLPYPNNLYHIIVYNNIIESQTSDTFLRNVHTFSDKANYPHVKASDQLPTTAEVEPYLRDIDNDVPYGYIPNIFKWHVDPGEPTPEIGMVVRLDMNAATTHYAGQDVILCKVVGRFGNTSNTDAGGDYLMMRVQGL